MRVFGSGEFENQQCMLFEVCDCSSEQQRALCFNLEKEGSGFGLNNHVGLEEGGLLSSIQHVHELVWTGMRGEQKKGREMRMEGASRGNHFTGGDVLAQ